MSEPANSETEHSLKKATKDILASIAQERERQIISRRFGLYDHKETLEQIGEMLGITRERVRQLEKAILTRLRAALTDGTLPTVSAADKLLVSHLAEMGRASRIQDLASHVFGHTASPNEKAHVAFLAELSPMITVLNENDDFYHAAVTSAIGDEKAIKQKINEIVKVIKKHGQPITAEELHTQLSYEHPSQITALASLSKKLAELKGNWGLVKWPTVNPKNIRDKIFVILEDNKKPMHFSEIAQAIKTSDFKRKNVTTQAIHNELIKDDRFVLIGRGIYALKAWGYSRGTVADIIAEILRKADGPLHRDEIIQKVLKSRQVKETTILLNLQSKPQFKRSAKATYMLVEADS